MTQTTKLFHLKAAASLHAATSDAKTRVHLLILRLHSLRHRHVMASSPVAKSINTRDITEKVRRELLLLLEAVCKHKTTRLSRWPADDDRYAARRTWYLNGRLLARSDYSSNSVLCRNMVSIRSSFSTTTMSTRANGTSSFWFGERRRRRCGR